jgi:hypothetical protein
LLNIQQNLELLFYSATYQMIISLLS